MQQTSTKIQDKVPLGGKGNLLGTVQEIKTWPYYLMVNAQTRIPPRE